MTQTKDATKTRDAPTKTKDDVTEGEDFYSNVEVPKNEE
jgi:hypothetical protein